MTVSLLAATPEGGGAALDQVIGMTVAATVVTVALLWIGYQHRMRRITWLNTLAERLGTRFHRPPWVALQILLFTATLICALFGFIWDVSLHIGKGRDPGPLANPAHYFILVGLFMLFIAGVSAVVLPYDKPGPSAVRITRTWYAPVGGLLMTACGLYALIGFPLDDIWHRIFGQDVTLWGPTHLMLIGGAGLSLIAVLFLEYEGRRAMNAEGAGAPPDGSGIRFLRYLSFGGLVVGLSVFQIEYDFGVEQFRLALQPMMIAAAGALAMVAARLVLGRGAAIAAALLSIALRGLVAVVVGPALGGPTSWFPTYLGAAVVVELLALTPLLKRHVVFGAVAGLLVGTVGLWLESFWIAAVYHYPWPTAMWPEALAMAVPVAVFMGTCGALLAMVLTGTPLPRASVGIACVLLTVLAIGGAVANGLRTEVPEGASARFTLTELPSEPGQRLVSADIRIDPQDLISDDPEWVTILSWQGGLANDRGLLIDRLDKLGPGHYRSTQPIPVWGSWKTLLRVQDGRTMAGVPIYLPTDPGIGAQGTAAEAAFTRDFVSEITILQRERNFNHPSWLFLAASLVVLFCTLALIAALTWGAGRINRSDSAPAGLEPPKPSVLPRT
ncbi:MAG: hypothetical protein HYZ38_10650 [Mycobacterium sp.]|nr:hypothetical protein [Mycobacterium sp.]